MLPVGRDHANLYHMAVRDGYNRQDLDGIYTMLGHSWNAYQMHVE